MSVIIDVTKVIQILLQDGEWRNVSDFKVAGRSRDAEYPWRFTGMAKGKDVQMEGTVATWITGGDNPREGERYACPVASILAIRYKE
jgi:hypothetical protein